MAGVRQVLGIFSLVVLVQWVSSGCVQRVPVPDLEPFRVTDCNKACAECTFETTWAGGSCTRFKKHVIGVQRIKKTNIAEEWTACMDFCQKDAHCGGAYLRNNKAEDNYDLDYCYLLQNVDNMPFRHSKRDKYVGFDNPCT